MQLCVLRALAGHGIVITHTMRAIMTELTEEMAIMLRNNGRQLEDSVTVQLEAQKMLRSVLICVSTVQQGLRESGTDHHVRCHTVVWSVA